MGSGLSKFMFTFGLGTSKAHRYQIIYASSAERARNIMCTEFDTRWAFQYNEEEWEKFVQRGKEKGYPMESPLSLVFVEESQCSYYKKPLKNFKL